MNLIIIAIGVFGLITADNLIKKVMCLSIIESTVILSFLGIGYIPGAFAPIATSLDAVMVDPVPQALMLTAIVIGVCFNAVAIACIVKLYQQKGTIEVSLLYD